VQGFLVPALLILNNSGVTIIPSVSAVKKEDNPLLAKELALFQKTILEVDSSVVYPNKNELKRKPKVIWLNSSMVKYSLLVSCAGIDLIFAEISVVK
jgi:hypothetical protein